MLSALVIQNAISQNIKEIKEDITIGEVNPAGVWLMTVKMTSDSQMYRVIFRNTQYQTIIDVKSFSITASEIDTFYNFIANKLLTLKEKKVYEMSNVTLTFWKKKIQFSLWNGTSWSYSAYFGLRQINKAFGKNSD